MEEEARELYYMSLHDEFKGQMSRTEQQVPNHVEKKRKQVASKAPRGKGPQIKPAAIITWTGTPAEEKLALEVAHLRKVTELDAAMLKHLELQHRVGEARLRYLLMKTGDVSSSSSEESDDDSIEELSDSADTGRKRPRQEEEGNESSAKKIKLIE
jgi:hypothetical protein